MLHRDGWLHILIILSEYSFETRMDYVLNKETNERICL